MGRNVPFLAISFLFFQVFSSVHAQTEVTYGLLECSKKFNYTSGDKYQVNLELVLQKLDSKSASLKFYNSTVGEGFSQVYAIYQCRMDISQELCNICVTQTTSEIFGECLFEAGEAILWYIECMVRYSTRNIFSSYEISPVFNKDNGDKVENKAEFVQRLRGTLTELIKNASSATPPFAFGITNWTSFERLFSYAQCTHDLDIFGCYACLRAAVAEAIGCCGEYRGAMVYLPSCQLRYDTKSSFLLGDLPRSTSSPHPPPPNKQGASNKVSSLKPAIIGAIGACVLVGLLVLAVVLWICLCCKKPKEETTSSTSSWLQEAIVRSDAQDLGETEFLQYDFVTLKTATSNFSVWNKIGHGGFGTVYKGTFENGNHLLAIKRLSSTSEQGTKEFMTEARLLAKLQHINLVKLVGFCMEGDEKLLVYEFMSNASLDGFLFDQTKRHLLNWATRCKIIMGIVKGLQYLHEDSRLPIVHCDLKPGNILLDNEMNPKIADFGLAKLFEGAQTHGYTVRVAGTVGYMAPEYLAEGKFSNKSDVYSFGIILLEIVSGQSNVQFYELRQWQDLPVHAWLLWKEGRSFELTDHVLLNNCLKNEVVRCIQIALLCLQSNVVDRPPMSSIVFMLNSSTELPLPSAPAMSFPQFNMQTTSKGNSSSVTDGGDLSFHTPRGW